MAAAQHAVLQEWPCIGREGLDAGLYAFRGPAWHSLSGSCDTPMLRPPWVTTGIFWGTIIAMRLKQSKQFS
jgi:hypothetical protein